jgi:hypothetical protein
VNRFTAAPPLDDATEAGRARSFRTGDILTFRSYAPFQRSASGR